MDQLDAETRKKLGIEAQMVPDRMIVLGRIIQNLEGMSRADALWTLRKAIKVMGGK